MAALPAAGERERFEYKCRREPLPHRPSRSDAGAEGVHEAHLGVAAHCLVLGQVALVVAAIFFEGNGRGIVFLPKLIYRPCMLASPCPSTSNGYCQLDFQSVYMSTVRRKE